jgi:hypothetical protein
LSFEISFFEEKASAAAQFAGNLEGIAIAQSTSIGAWRGWRPPAVVVYPMAANSQGKVVVIS